jgi:hypothetical protein
MRTVRAMISTGMAMALLASLPDRADTTGTTAIKSNSPIKVTQAQPSPKAAIATPATAQKSRPANQALATGNQLEGYKEMVLKSVGSRWLKKVDPLTGTLSPGTVRIQYTIDGSGFVRTKRLDTAVNLEMLNQISDASINECVLFPPFSGELQREVGDQVKGQITFSISPDKKPSLK